MRTGTCEDCNATGIAVVQGKLVEHRRKLGQFSSIGGVARYSTTMRMSAEDRAIVERCFGSNRRPKEMRERERSKRRTKRQAEVDAVRDVSAVISDVILTGRKDLDNEFPPERRAELLKTALVGYRLAFPKARAITDGLHWWSGQISKGLRGHRVFCRFCGHLLATLPSGVWSRLTDDERRVLHEHHVTLCALQYLAGVRKLVEPGTMLTGHDGVLFEDALQRQCRACGALPGAACVAIEANEKHIAITMPEPHEIRRYV